MEKILLTILILALIFPIYATGKKEHIGLTPITPTNGNNPMRIKISVNGQNLTATLADNSSAGALYEMLLKDDLIINARDYGNFEKVGDLPDVLPRNDEEISTTAGDIILYLGNSIAFYYNSNSWNFTRLGRVDNAESLNLREIYGNGNAVFRLSYIKEGSYRLISQEEAARIMAEWPDVVVLDVRTREEFASGHIPGAVCIPNETIGRTPPAELPDRNQTILIYCRSGNRSKQASRKLADMGYTDIREFGGINTWKGAVISD